MKKVKLFVIYFLVLSIFPAMAISTSSLLAQEKFDISTLNSSQYKQIFDDPRPWAKEFYTKVLPPTIYKKLTYDMEAMKKAWAEAIGFKAPDVVGKIAPEIKPGKYSYKDKEKYPGLKELMIPYFYERFKPGGPPFAGNFSEITIVPTRQYYVNLPLAEATKKTWASPNWMIKATSNTKVMLPDIPFLNLLENLKLDKSCTILKGAARSGRVK